MLPPDSWGRERLILTGKLANSLSLCMVFSLHKSLFSFIRKPSKQRKAWFTFLWWPNSYPDELYIACIQTWVNYPSRERININKNYCKARKPDSSIMPKASKSTTAVHVQHTPWTTLMPPCMWHYISELLTLCIWNMSYSVTNYSCLKNEYGI